MATRRLVLVSLEDWLGEFKQVGELDGVDPALTPIDHLSAFGQAQVVSVLGELGIPIAEDEINGGVTIVDLYGRYIAHSIEWYMS